MPAAIRISREPGQPVLVTETPVRKKKRTLEVKLERDIRRSVKDEGKPNRTASLSRRLKKLQDGKKAKMHRTHHGQRRR